jgi:tRNA dimethylallyltransferase
VLVVVGPTAVGKTELAEELAVRLGGEIVSADSMQVYRGMDIGTAKPPASRRRVRHHCIDVVDPGQPYSAALYQAEARRAIADITSRGLLPVVAGGTGLYVRAALDPWVFPSGEQQENPVRNRFQRIADEQGAEAVHALLADRDPASARLIHRNNIRRVVRALEMLEEGTSYAEQAAGLSDRVSIYDARFLGLTMERERLYARIEERVDAMMDAGLLGEVKGLLEAGFREALTAQQAIGYKELVPVIEEGAPVEEAVSAIKRASRRYAKRQLTWFRADPRIRWLDVTEPSSAQTADAAIAALDWD